jgi:integrase
VSATAQSDEPIRVIDSLPAGVNDSLSGREYLIQNVERNGVVMPEIDIKEVTIVARPTKESARKRDYRKYERLIYNLKKVYPYAAMVRRKLDEVNNELSHIKSEKEKKEYIKDFEKNIFKEYEGDMRQMTISQGKLLIKLIDRETQNTSYDLIRDYRGKFTAAFWQGIAKIFGTNLKEQYDPFGEDALIEVLLQEIENGQL